MKISAECCHCNEIHKLLIENRIHRDADGVDVWTCSECKKKYKLDMPNYILARSTSFRDAVKTHPDYVDFSGETNRHVPWIMGLVALGLAIWIVIYFTGWWTYLLGAVLLIFGLGSLKTALHASDQEVAELTGSHPMSQETRGELEDQL